MYKYFIKYFIIILIPLVSFSQNESIKKNDTIVYKQKYGLRVGVDIAKLVRSFSDDNYSGFEIMGDYRLTKRIYIAGELGNEERIIDTDNLNNTTTGSYFKGGIDINFYQNWLDMENMIYAGFRVGASTFSQTLNNYEIYNPDNQYWDQQFQIDNSQEFDGLNALWGEIIIGLKAELFNNFFAGINVQIKAMVSESEIDNYENLYIPGFNRTYDSGRFGSGFGFNLSYLVPVFKKNKLVVNDTNTDE